MDLILLILVAFGASWLTFFSGFGLSTLLTPVFLLIFHDLPLAIAATAVVHFLNNVFKFLLMHKSINWKIVLPFGVAAIPAAAVGAIILDKISNQSLLEYTLFNRHFSIYLLDLIFGIILILFALIELIPKWSMSFAKQQLWIGGIISGFFGGLSGHQGALRTAFLIKYKLDKEVFISSGIFIALLIDIVRTPIYFANKDLSLLQDQWQLIFIALLSALVGAISGRYFLKKIKLITLNIVVAIAMLIFGVALTTGVIVH